MADLPSIDELSNFRGPGAVAMQNKASGPSTTPTDEQSSEEAPEVGSAQALVRGLGQGASFGFGDEAAAGIKSALGQGKYEDLVKKERDLDKAAAEQHPYLYHGGQIGGGLAT